MIPVKVRIFSVLIFVAVLSFSVRLVDIAMGVRSFSGMAYAEDAAHEPAHKEEAAVSGHEDAEEEKEKSPGFTFEEDEGEAGAHDGEEAEVDPTIELYEDKGVEWRDATDTEISYSNVRQELNDDLATRRSLLDQKEKEIKTREALLEASQREIDRKYKELSQLRVKIESLLKQQSDEEQARIQSLVKIYEGMKAKDAARIFDTLDIDVLISVMGRMSERKLSPILAEMNAERARTVTILLAEEKQLPTLP